MLIMAIIIITIAIGAYFYPMLPDTIVSHWGSSGEPNGYSSKLFIMILIPILMVGIWFLMEFLPRIDPMKKNVAKFIGYYDIIKLIVVGLLAYVYIISIIWNLGFEYNMGMLLGPAFAFMLYCIGMTLDKTKRNWFIGIRTPWTLSSDVVWDKTHKFGSKAFKITAIIVLLSIFVPDYTFIVLTVSLLSMVIIVFAYSYFEFKKIKPGKKA